MMTKFNWGDSVRVKEDVHLKFIPGLVGEVVGIDEVQSEERAMELEVPVGTTVYLVEFEDGSSMELKGEYLEVI